MLNVRVERKRENGHPWFREGSPTGYALMTDSGYIQGGTIGVPYTSRIRIGLADESVRGHPFYITRDPVGGTDKQVLAVTEQPPTDKGTLEFVPVKDFDLTPKERTQLESGTGSVRLYYQCDHHPKMGGVFEVLPAADKGALLPVDARFLPHRTPSAKLRFFRQLEGLDQPVFGVSSSEQNGRYFYIGEQEGKVWEVDTFTTVRSSDPLEEDPLKHAGMWGEYSLLVDVSLYMEGLFRIDTPYAGVNVEERGLLGMAVHPEFHERTSRNHGVFFLYFSTAGGKTAGFDHYGCLYRFTTLSRTNRNPVDIRNSAREVLCVEEPFPNHNGGSMLFGPRDRMLYLGLGDGGAQGDPEDRAQSLLSLHGKILRLDVDAYDTDMPYRIPKDNPLVEGKKGLPEIYAWGFRNPWGMDFIGPKGPLVVSDTGERAWEEVNLVGPGRNYGWSYYEGRKVRRKSTSRTDRERKREAVSPAFAYKHGNRGRRAIVGAKFYTSTKHPELRHTLIVADMSGWIGVLLPKGIMGAYRVVISGQLPEGETVRALCRTREGTVYALTHNKAKKDMGGTVWEISVK